MKILFIGLGSIGQKHARLLNEGYKHELFALRSKNETQSKTSIIELHNWDLVAQHKPDVAFITNPTSMHIATALRCAQLGCKLFLEKPLGHSKDGLDDLVNIISQNKLVSYIAYNLRFHPVIQKIKEYLDRGTFLHMHITCSSYLPNWRPEQEVKKSCSANAALGGGVVLDLSHEIDYTEYLLGRTNSISGSFSRRSDITVDVEDYADLILSCERGPANIHINFFSHIKQRVIQIDFKECSLTADLINGTILEYKNESLINRHMFDCPRDYTYIKQLEYFFAHIDDRQMMNNIPEASALYKQIINLKE